MPYDMPGELKEAIRAFIEYYNYRRYHEGLGNVTPYREDNRDLRKALAKLGLEYADCFCGELSPESHELRKRDGSIGVTVGNLWHLHGFLG